MGFFGTRKEKVIEPVKSISILDILENEIAETDRSIEQVILEVGHAYVQLHKDDTLAELLEQMIPIKTLEQKKKTLIIRKLACQGLRECEECHQYIALDSVFCNKCGAKLEPLDIAEDTEKRCPTCGAKLEDGAQFCTSCGTQIMS